MNSFVADELYRDFYYWTGGYKTHNRDGVSWRWWSDQTQGTMSYTSWDWLAGQPDGDKEKDEYRITIEEKGKWHDRSGNEKHKFICSKKASPGMVFI